MDYLKRFKRTNEKGETEVGYKEFMTFLELAADNGVDTDEEYFLLHPLKGKSDDQVSYLKKFKRGIEDGAAVDEYKEFATYFDLLQEDDFEEEEQYFSLYPLPEAPEEARTLNALKEMKEAAARGEKIF